MSRFPWRDTSEDISQATPPQWETPGGAQDKVDEGIDKFSNLPEIGVVDGAITTRKIRDENVVESKIANGAVTGPKIADRVVTTEKLADGSVIATKIQDAAITPEKLKDGSITTQKLKDANVTLTKISEEVLDSANHKYKGLAKGSTVKDAIDSQQKWIDNIIENSGDSVIEIVDARVSATGQIYNTMKSRLDTEHSDLTQQLTDIGTKKADKAETVAKEESITKSVMPDKIGVKTKSPKLVIVGATDDVLKVVQYNGIKYVMYTLHAGQGDTSSTSVGGHWDLIRLRKVELVAYAYVAKTIYDPSLTVGTVGTFFAPALRSNIENLLMDPMNVEDSSVYESSTGNGYGIGLYSLSGASSVSSVTWKINIGTKKRGNILVYGSPGSSASADILVNGEVVKSFDPTKLAVDGSNRCKLIEFDLPYNDSSGVVSVTLRNNDVTGKVVYFSCCNYMQLKDYDGSDIDFYKVLTTSSKYIDAAGASDYAIFDADLSKWCGSFHGGETRVFAKITWSSGTNWRPVNQWDTGRQIMLNKSTISPGWIVLPTFKIQQLTNINDKGQMLSTFDFDTDGTMEMAFSYYGGSIRATSFFTALTATHIEFTSVSYPQYGSLPSGTAPLYFVPNDGHIKQYNPSKYLTLGIRFTRFLSQFQNPLKKNGWIFNDPAYYKKFYYGVIDDYAPSATISSLQWRKALDFIYGE